MNLFKKIKNRYNILIIFSILMMLLLSFRLATLTVAQGDYYRDVADNKRLKKVYVTAPRGEIRDRNGKILAENQPSFTVQILKDELKNVETKEKNDILLKLVRLLEEDGVIYIDDFPIEFNVFQYSNEETYSKEDTSPTDKVIDIIIEKNLLPQILDTYYIHPDYEAHYQFITINKAIHALEQKGIDMPIKTNLKANKVEVSFDDKKDIKSWKNNHEFSQNYSPKQSILALVKQDKTIIKKIIDHPIARELTYNILKQKNLNKDLILTEYLLSYDEEYSQQKRDLIESFSGISSESKAKDDFVEIVTETALAELLEKLVEIENDRGKTEKIAPGEILIKNIEEKGLKSPVDIEINEENDIVTYTHKDKKEDEDNAPINSLIEFAKDEGLLKDFITDDDVKNTAQETILANGVNPKISVSKWEYISMVEKEDWFKKFKISKDKKGEEVFAHLKKHFEIQDDLSKYETFSIMFLYNQLDKQGHRAYQPINIAYGIKDTTVARIEEGMVDTAAFQVSVEPVRHYPEGETAAHILGYLGKISQPNEIKKYVDEKEYSPNDLIGKTGIEQNFESELRGTDGIKRIEVDVLGNTTNVLDEAKGASGNNIYLTIDLKLQKVAEEVLQRTLEQIQRGGSFRSRWGNHKFKPYRNATSGAVVVESVKTGEILALANYPAYDPNLFSTGISSTDWESLFPENEADLLAPRPLYNIAIQTAVQPGSTFKMVTALAALEKGLSPTKTIRDMGYVTIGNQTMGCWLWNSSKRTHGPVNVYQALRDSCNYYFYSLALGKNQRTGQSLGMKLEIDDIIDMSKKLGLDDKTGIEINIPNETSGGVPSPQNKIKTTKALLKRDLQEDIKNYIKEGEKFSEEEIEEKIDQIIGWLEIAEPLSRNEVINRLDKMGLDPEKRIKGKREGLADKIKYTYIDYAGWNILDTLNITIGQGQNSYTPIQMANFVSIISNGGYRHKVTAVDKIKNSDNTKTLYERKVEPTRIELNNYENLEHVKLGMRKVASEGTARRQFSNFPVSVAAKTGTAQRENINPTTGRKYDDYAWFVAFAPYEEPEIAISVILFQGGSGGYAGPMTREIIAEYMGLND